jgi:formate hydrogenlyase subunit 4
VIAVGKYALFVILTFLLPLLVLGVIRQSKARMQGRVGAPMFQPFSDLIKLFRKDQTISETATWIFRISTALNAATMLVIAWIVPWLSFKPAFPGDDLFLLLYLLALLRFMMILSSLDSGSPFGAFAASREAYLAMLVEPAAFISLGALGLVAHSSSLSVIFDLSPASSIYYVPVWLAAGMALFLAAIVDLSRMPIDDPTTHLELTMVHEAMIWT